MMTFFFYILFVISIFSFFSIAPWVPTKKKDLARIKEIITLEKGESFLEIGCGTARVSLALAKKYPQAHLYAIELSPFFYMISKIKTYFGNYKNVTIMYGNALKLNFSLYDVIYVFGMPNILNKTFAPKLEKQMKKNARFYFYVFQMTETRLKEIKYKDKKQVTIYKYIKT